MSSYSRADVYNKISFLEDKVNRLEEIIDDRSNTYVDTAPPYYESAVRLSQATRNLKQDLIHNPRHSKLSRENYQQIYQRVSNLEKELNEIVQNMSYGINGSSDYDYYSKVKSEGYYDYPSSQRHKTRPKRGILREPQLKQVSYDSYVEVMPSDTSSSETVEEIIYYIESSSTPSSSSSSVIVEEYVPKSYTKRSVRKPPFIDVSKSKPRSEKSPRKSRTKHDMRSERDESENKKRKSKKPKKEKRKNKANRPKSDSESNDPTENSEMFLVKRSKDSSKATKKRKEKEKKDKDKKEKYLVSRLKKVSSSEDEDDNKKISSRSQKGDAKTKHQRNQEKSDESQTKLVKSKKSNRKRKPKEEVHKKSPTESVNTVSTVARSSFILNDPFVRTIYYDDFDSHGEEDTHKIVNNSVYKMSNSIYSFDPYLKQKKKLYPKSESEDFASVPQSKNKSRVQSVNKTNIILTNVGASASKRQREKGGETHRKYWSLEEVNNKSRPLSPVAHSVYLTTVPVYQTISQEYQRLSYPEKKPAKAARKISAHQEKSASYFETHPSQIPSQHKYNLEDEILINVARKLSPVVAKIINSEYLKSKEIRSPSPTKSKTENLTDSHSNSRNSIQGISNYEMNIDKDYRFKRISRPVTQIYTSQIEDDDSPLQPVKSKKSLLKKTSTLANLFKKASLKNRSSVSSKRESVLKNRGSNKSLISKSGSNYSLNEQRGSQSNINQQRESQINQQQKRVSRISMKPQRASTIKSLQGSKVYQNQQRSSMTDVETRSENPVEGENVFSKSPSRVKSQSIQPKKSVLSKTPSQAQNKKGHHFKSIFNRVTNKQEKEPALRGILNKMKGGDGKKTSKVLTQKMKQSSKDSKQHQLDKLLSYDPNLSDESEYEQALRKQVGDLIDEPEEDRTEQKRSRVYSKKLSAVLTKGPDETNQDIYAGSRAYLNQIRSVSQYMERPELKNNEKKEELRLSYKATMQSGARDYPPPQEMKKATMLSGVRDYPQTQEMKKASMLFGVRDYPPPQDMKKASMLSGVRDYPPPQDMKKASMLSGVRDYPPPQDMKKASMLSGVRDYPPPQDMKKASMLSGVRDYPPPQDMKKASMLSGVRDYPPPQEMKKASMLSGVRDYPSPQEMKKSTMLPGVTDYPPPQEIKKPTMLSGVGGYPPPQEMKKLSMLSGVKGYPSQFPNEYPPPLPSEYPPEIPTDPSTFPNEYPPQVDGENIPDFPTDYPPPDHPPEIEIRYPPAFPTDYPPVIGEYPSVESEYPSVKGEYPPVEGEYPSVEAEYPPVAGNETVGPEMESAEATTINESENYLEDLYRETIVTDRTNEDLYKTVMKPMRFCIHYSKEKRTKFETQSSLSLDEILTSQCKKVYSSEDISLSEYMYDSKTESYVHRKILPKDKQRYEKNSKLSKYNKRQGTFKNSDYLFKGLYSNSDCCCKKLTKSEHVLSDTSYVDWHKVANEIKQTK